VFVKLRVEEWVHKDLWVAGRRKTSIQLAVSVRSLPRCNTACGIRVGLLHWLHRDRTVRSCSIIIFSVYVLCDVSINEAVSQKPNSRSEEEGTGTRHAVVTEVEFMFLDISWCFCMQYRWAESNSCLCWCNIAFGIFQFCACAKSCGAPTKFVPAVCVSVRNKSGIPVHIFYEIGCLSIMVKFIAEFKVRLQSGKITPILYEDPYSFLCVAWT
jgi:hypothetical protein